MADNQEKINQLLEKLEILVRKQEFFSREINELKNEITGIKASGNLLIEKEEIELQETAPQSLPVEQPEALQPIPFPQPSIPKISKLPKVKSDFEKFIGENLINKVGIAITIIGVAIGAKYSIENDLISPLTRIILGYLTGLGLLAFGMKLKKKYEPFSAVLVSGAMAIMYFITFAAYSFYELVPQAMTFLLMVVFTVFTVVAAINYNRQVIAHIGLVGAYAVPFLLSDGSGKIAVLYSYMAIINIGILVIAFKRYWKSLYYAAFGLTWFIYFIWFIADYRMSEHFNLALIFLTIFFAIFYLTFLAYKLLRQEKFDKGDIMMLLINSFLFYGFGFGILNRHETGEQLLGLFTLGNAILHFIVSTIIYKQKLADRNLFYLVSGLVLVFITIAVPVQLDGNWVTLLWAAEAALLFWIGRTKNVPVYEKLSYPLMLLAFISIVQDWSAVYESYIYYYDDISGTSMMPLLNVNFLSSLLFIAAFVFINHLLRNNRYTPALISKKWLMNIISYSIPAILLITIYYAFRLEIANYWNHKFAASALEITQEGNEYPDYYRNFDLQNFRIIWILNYSLLFASILSFVNIKKLKNRELGFVSLGLNVICIAVFLLQGLYAISELRDSYLGQSLAEYYHRGVFNIVIRYISYAFVVGTLVASYKYIRQEFLNWDFQILYDCLLHISILWIASSELINWMDIGESQQSYKLGLSILWGIYSLMLIGYGIWQKKKHLRIGAITLFGVTLAKLFFYDISHLNTISKTIVFVSLGILLLIISFLYNKYKHIISDEPES